MAPTVDDVRSILCDFELRMRSVLNDAWDEWMEIPDRGRILGALSGHQWFSISSGRVLWRSSMETKK